RDDAARTLGAAAGAEAEQEILEREGVIKVFEIQALGADDPAAVIPDQEWVALRPDHRRSNRSRIAFCAWSRFSAWSNTMLRSPSSTSSVISSPRCAGRQWSTHASGAFCKSSSLTW